MDLILGLIGWAIFGLIVGAIARFLIPGRQSMSWLMTMVLGIIGSLAGGTLWNLVAGGEFSLSSSGWIGSVIGAVLVLLAYIFATKNRAAV